MSKKIFQSDLLVGYDVNGNYKEGVNPEGKFYFEFAYVVCNECKGHGTHFRRDLDEDALVQSMLEDGDEEGVENYYRGRFDEVCSKCKGARVVGDYILPDWARKEIFDFYQWQSKQDAIRDSERRVGA